MVVNAAVLREHWQRYSVIRTAPLSIPNSISPRLAPVGMTIELLPNVPTDVPLPVPPLAEGEQPIGKRQFLGFRCSMSIVFPSGQARRKTGPSCLTPFRPERVPAGPAMGGNQAQAPGLRQPAAAFVLAACCGNLELTTMSAQ